MTEIIVTADTETSTTGTLLCNGKTYACTLGRSGVIAEDLKTEGDGKTPIGSYPCRYVLWRQDRLPEAPRTGLPAKPLVATTGWCEDPKHADYNREVTLPHPSPDVDRMFRDDYLYDVVVVLGHNDNPPVPYKGSAIFMHLAREAFTPTAGCIGLARADLIEVLAQLTPETVITIKPPKF